jgi:hypothetical protein
LGGAERGTQLGRQHVGLAFESIGRLHEVASNGDVEVALERLPRRGRGEVLEVLETDGGRTPVSDLPCDLQAEGCGVVNQTGTPQPS